MQDDDSKSFFRTIVLVVILAISFLSFSIDEKASDPYPLQLPVYFGGRFTIPEDNPLTKEGVHLGRLLFYETKLSKNDKVSCGTCHQQKLAFTDGKPFSVGVDGTLTKRSSMSLTNLLWVRNFFWDGRVNSLEAQAIVPITDSHEMGISLDEAVSKLKATTQYPELFYKAFGTKDISDELILKSIAQFERTLISADAPYDRYLRGEHTLNEEEMKGMKLFMTTPSPERNIRGANCGHCHGTPKLFSELFHNNGLDSVPKDAGRMEFTRQAIDNGRFRVPTLRNIVLTAPYMHDGRFNTLEEVLTHYNEHIQASETLSPFVAEATNEAGGKSLLLTEDERKSIITFLHTLTDSTFIANPAFADPNVSANTKQF